MFLVTTADRRFWKTDETILFLGEWCKRYRDKDAWLGLEHKVLPHHRDDAASFAVNLRHIDSMYEKYLRLLADRLNRIHGTNYSLRYWRILLGIWLRAFVEALYDRYLSIISARDSGNVSGTWICATDPWTPVTPPSFSHDSYNLYLFSKIIKHLGGISYEEKPWSHQPDEAMMAPLAKTRVGRFVAEVVRQFKKGPAVFLRQGVAVLAVETYPRLIKYLRSRVVFVGTMYLSLIDQARLQLSIGQTPYLYHGEKLAFESRQVDKSVRLRLSLPAESNPFEQLLVELLPEQLPMLYVEHYIEMHSRALAISPRAPKLAITAMTINYRGCFEFWAAHHVDRSGTKLAAIQHGGGYGTGRYLNLDDHICKAFDRYYTWGSTHEGNPKVKPMPSFRLLTSAKKLRRVKRSGPIIWLASTVARYDSRYETGTSSSQMLEYFAEQRRFYENLVYNARALLVWRYAADPWDDLDRIREFAPNLLVRKAVKKQLGRDSDFAKQVLESRLAVHTVNETTYLETLAANFPTLVYWNSQRYQVQESLEPAFACLVKAGVLHYTPESAASKLNTIYQDPLKWWYSTEVQEARERFCQCVAWTDDDWLRVWKIELTSMIEE
jgi:putative transferase (TIGR04331 family)